MTDLPGPADEGPIEVAGVSVPPGERRRVEIPVAQSYGHADLFLPAVVSNGRQPGPRLFLSAAIHGDEINGVEIIRRVLGLSALRRLRGSLLAVPVVNVYGFLSQNRYLPDRRDLNRSFPGSPSGSLAARLAHIFMTEIVSRCTHGIDFHTGSYHRTNLPQIRACIDQPETARLARAFGAPVILNTNVRDGSLRQAVSERQIPMLLYEAGEVLRFDEVSIRAGVRGVLAVMRALEMLPPSARTRPGPGPAIARGSVWVRAPGSGVLRARAALGDRVARDGILGLISDPLGDSEIPVPAPRHGIVIGRTNLPLVNEGDALYHLAHFDRPEAVADRLEAFHAAHDPSQADSPSGEPPVV